MIVATAITCMALNIYHESRGEPLTGQHAVAQVTWNRAKHNVKNVCLEVTKHHQFSWTNTMVSKVSGKFYLNSKGVPKDKVAWQRAQYIAKYTVEGMIPDFTHGATYYHTRQIRTVWDRKLILVAVVGQHNFYIV